ncbi:alpha/beta fold hydrolase [Cryptosporangium phraense]|nr:alpha/beta fold hydrolase [Cryptosporangium phraense]
MYLVARDGLRLSYDVLPADGPTVVLLHGFAGTAEANWVRTGVAGALHRAGRRVVLPDARGHGHSDRPHQDTAYTGGVFVTDVEDLLDRLGTPVDLVGYSMGAFTAARVVPHPQVRSVVLAGVGDAVLHPRECRSREAIATAMLADSTDPLGHRLRRYADLLGADRQALAAAQRGAAFDEPAGVRLGRTPVLVLAGEDDRAVGDPAALAAAIPGARLALVPGDHMTAPADPAFAAALLAYLQSNDRFRTTDAYQRAESFGVRSRVS